MTAQTLIPRPLIAVSMGDPLGIGPEVTVKALSDPAIRCSARFHIHGLSGPMLAAAELAGIEPFWWKVPFDSPLLETTTAHDVVLLDYTGPEGESGAAWLTPEAGNLGRATPEGGRLSFRFVADAISSTLPPTPEPVRPRAIVTGPINKAAWAMAGHGKFPGHTELLASRYQSKRTRMMFEAPNLRTILVTTHIPLNQVSDGLNIGRVFETIELGHAACRTLGVQRPRLAVCGLNPHASEGGLFGDEEKRVIEPAIRMAREQGMEVSGPYPGDTIFHAAVRGKYDMVVAMYHDQGLIPVKLLAFDKAVNATVGLPVVRTSPDHGTAYDIAGKNLADSGSMKAAVELAVRLVTRQK